jgi:hypothetical protein
MNLLGSKAVWAPYPSLGCTGLCCYTELVVIEKECCFKVEVTMTGSVSAPPIQSKKMLFGGLYGVKINGQQYWHIE